MIAVEHLWKTYHIPVNTWNQSLRFLTFGRMGKQRAFHALSDVSFRLEKGTSLGIIGENGAGKSTLLKVISSVSCPTSGSVQVEGRVSALLELGTGFHPDLTGQENVYTYMRLFNNGARPSGKLMQQVEDFAELGAFFHEPLRMYSTGMLVRLAFAAACFVDPDVLLVDEALAVGDAYFQQKCLDKIEQFQKRGVNLLFVSHAMPLVQMFCDRALYLEGGRVAALGSVSEVIAAYERATAIRRGLIAPDSNTEQAATHQAPEYSELTHESPARTIGSRYGNGKIRITGVAMHDSEGRPHSRFCRADSLVLRIDYEADGDYPNAVFSVAIFRIDGVYIFATNNLEVDNTPLPVHKGRGSVHVRIGPLGLHRGVFSLTSCVYTEPQPPFWTDPADYHHKRYEFHVVSDEFPHGCVRLPARWWIS